MTLVEVAGATGALLVALLATFAVFHGGVRATGANMQVAEVRVSARRILETIVERIQSSSAATFETSAGVSSSLVFRRAQAYVDGEIEWGPRESIAFERESGEPDNGLDDDGDGLVDEGSIVLRRDLDDPSEAPVVLARGVPERLEGETENGEDDNGNGLVDEPGLCFALEGTELSVRLTVARRLANGGPVVRQSAETVVLARNP